MIVHAINVIVLQNASDAFCRKLTERVLPTYGAAEGSMGVEIWRRVCVGYVSYCLVSKWDTEAHAEAFGELRLGDLRGDPACIVIEQRMHEFVGAT